MKVVLFCGGLGIRMREYSESIPKPMVEIGYRPIIWHLMKYYAFYGHKDFILCLGYRGDMIKKYFLNYDEFISNDLVMSNGGKNVHLYNSDIEANIGERLKAIEPYIGDDPVFMANYSDGLTDLFLPKYLDKFYQRNKIASFLCVKAAQSFHVVNMGEDDLVTGITAVGESNLLINGGFFIFKRDIFNCIQDGEELVREPFQRLIAQEQLMAYRHDGFWACMDTFKEKQSFDDMHSRGETPWTVWKQPTVRARNNGVSHIEHVQAA
jgi:glucose-1-phosphate cytidylyltransferase